MKILQSITKVYQEQKPVMDLLKARVDTIVTQHKKETWHYYSRVKTQESFALKVETSRVDNLTNLEDFFACTIVVENIKEIKTAIEVIENHFTVESRRPKNDEFTHKESYNFQFDDLRLYCRLQEINYLPEDNLPKLLFELQIKTFLQHAWAIATHDMIYKAGESNWPKERVAYQIKAMLEQAEISISGSDSLSQLPELSKTNYESKSLNEIATFLKKTFDETALPLDVLRLARIVGDCLKNFQLRLTDLDTILQAENKEERGSKTLNLSPYAIIIQSIINQRPDQVQKIFKASNKLPATKKIFIPDEVEVNETLIEDPSKLIRISKL